MCSNVRLLVMALPTALLKRGEPSRRPPADHQTRHRTACKIMASREEEYRRLSQECLAMVGSVSTEEARNALIEMARIWSRLADEQATALTPNSNAPAPFPPHEHGRLFATDRVKSVP